MRFNQQLYNELIEDGYDEVEATYVAGLYGY